MPDRDPPTEADLDRWMQFEERAAICQYDGRLTRAAAEELARAELEGWEPGCRPTTQEGRRMAAKPPSDTAPPTKPNPYADLMKDGRVVDTSAGHIGQGIIIGGMPRPKQAQPAKVPEPAAVPKSTKR